MKLLLVFAFLALVCMGRSAPVQSTPRVLILPDYHSDDDEANEQIKPHEDETHVVDENEGEDADADEDETTSTTAITTTTSPPPTRRSTFVFPTRNRNLIPSRRPELPKRTTSIRTTTTTTAEIIRDDDQEENDNEYDGDFKYVRDFRKYFQKLLEDIKKIVKNFTGYEFSNSSKRPQYQRDEE